MLHQIFKSTFRVGIELNGRVPANLGTRHRAKLLFVILDTTKNQTH